MTNTGLDVFDSSIQKSIGWIDDIAGELGHERRQYGYTALRSVLHTLRDRLTVQEAANLSAQLPLMIRGVFFDGWTPANVPVTIRQRDEFLDYLTEQMGPQVTNIPPTDALRAVLTVLQQRISEGEMEDIFQMLPEDLQQLWTEAMSA